MSNPPSVMLCASQEELNVSSSFAFSADELRALPWLTICSDASLAREELRDNPQYQEAWVSSSDEMSVINLAAAIKQDSPRLSVYLLQRDGSESVERRARAAGLDGILSPQQLVWRCETHDVPSGSSRKTPDAAETSRAGVSPEAEGSLGTQAQAGVESPGGSRERVGARDPLSGSRYQQVCGDELAQSGYLLSVLSGTGGAGKSTVAALTAHLAQRRGLKTVVVDGDLRFGDMADLCGTAVRIPVASLAEDVSLLSAVPEDELVVVAAPQRLEEAEAVAPFFDIVVRQLLRTFDLVVVNTGGPWEEHHAFLLEASMTTLLLIDQRASSIRACRHALDLCLRCGVAAGSLQLLLNRCHKQASFTAADVSGALQGAHVVELREGGCEVEELMGSGLTDALVCSGNPLCQSLDRLIDEIVPVQRRAVTREERMVVDSDRSALGRGRRGVRRRGQEPRSRRRKASARAERRAQAVR